jgi:hypothetical protein
MKSADSAFVSAWLEEWRADPPVYGNATRRLMMLIEKKPDDAWHLISLLVRAAPNDEELDCVGAGPLEDLLCAHGPQVISRLESAAAQDSKFVRCVYFVWGQSRMDPETYRRVRSIAPSSKFVALDEAGLPPWSEHDA